jgi:hypothetical protein
MDNTKIDITEVFTLLQDFLDSYQRPQEIFTEEEAANYLRVPLQTLKNYSKRKKISWCLIGKKKIYTKEQLNEFLERRVRLHQDW